MTSHGTWLDERKTRIRQTTSEAAVVVPGSDASSLGQGDVTEDGEK